MSDAPETCRACLTGECDDHIDFAGLLSRIPAEHGPGRAAYRAARSDAARDSYLGAASVGASFEQCKTAARVAAAKVR